MRSAIFGILAGIAGAAVWAGIAYFAGYELGWVAWGIGALVGFACAKGSERGGAQVALLAAGITIMSLLAGKYLAVELLVDRELGSVEEAVADVMANFENEEYIISYLADEVVGERMEAGEPLDWPAGVDPDEGGAEAADYPADVWAEAEGRWNAMSADDQVAFLKETSDAARDGVVAFHEAVSSSGFTSSFGFMDLIFFGLAIVTAYSIAKNDLDGDPDGDLGDGDLGGGDAGDSQASVEA